MLKWGHGRSLRAAIEPAPMSAEQRFHLNRLADKLVTRERFDPKMRSSIAAIMQQSMTARSWASYIGRNKLDAATLDRWSA